MTLRDFYHRLYERITGKEYPGKHVSPDNQVVGSFMYGLNDTRNNMSPNNPFNCRGLEREFFHSALEEIMPKDSKTKPKIA
jgi:hypothetical protein